MSETASSKEKMSQADWTAIALGISTLSMAVCSAVLAKGWYDAAERDTERGLAYDSIAVSLAAHELVATQLDVQLQDNTFGFVGYEGKHAYICEGIYEYDGGKVTVKFDELECIDASTAEQTETA